MPDRSALMSSVGRVLSERPTSQRRDSDASPVELLQRLRRDRSQREVAQRRQRRPDGCDPCRSRQLAAGFRGQTLGQTHGLEDQQRYATLWAIKDTAGGGQDNTAA